MIALLISNEKKYEQQEQRKKFFHVCAGNSEYFIYGWVAEAEIKHSREPNEWEKKAIHAWKLKKMELTELLKALFFHFLCVYVFVSLFCAIQYIYELPIMNINKAESFAHAWKKINKNSLFLPQMTLTTHIQINTL